MIAHIYTFFYFILFFYRSQWQLTRSKLRGQFSSCIFFLTYSINSYLLPVLLSGLVKCVHWSLYRQAGRQTHTLSEFTSEMYIKRVIRSISLTVSRICCRHYLCMAMCMHKHAKTLNVLYLHTNILITRKESTHTQKARWNKKANF